MQSLVEVENTQRSYWLKLNYTDIYDVYTQFQVFIKSEYVYKIYYFFYCYNLIITVFFYLEYQVMKKYLKVLSIWDYHFLELLLLYSKVSYYLNHIFNYFIYASVLIFNYWLFYITTENADIINTVHQLGLFIIVSLVHKRSFITGSVLRKLTNFITSNPESNQYLGR